MGCGCTSKPAGPDLSAVAMCLVCPNRDGPIQCTIDGRPAIGRRCPLGRHPDEGGVIRWAGLEWYGVPYPVRWAIRRRWFRRLVGGGASIASASLPGCGCYKPLKDLLGFARAAGSSATHVSSSAPAR